MRAACCLSKTSALEADDLGSALAERALDHADIDFDLIQIAQKRTRTHALCIGSLPFIQRVVAHVTAPAGITDRVAVEKESVEGRA